MDKITTILLIVGVFLIVIWLSMSNIVNLNSNSFNINQNSHVNDNLNAVSNGNNASIKILSSNSLTKNEKVIVQLSDSNNQPLLNKNIHCRFLNSSSSIGNSYVATTNENGIAEFNLDYLNRGFYAMELEYKNYDNNIGGCIIKENIEIK